MTSILLQHNAYLCYIIVWLLKNELQLVNIPRSRQPTPTRWRWRNRTKQHTFKDDDWRTRANNSRFIAKSRITNGRFPHHKALFFPRGRVGVQCGGDNFGLFFPCFHLFKITQAKQKLRMPARTLLDVLVSIYWTGQSEKSEKEYLPWQVCEMPSLTKLFNNSPLLGGWRMLLLTSFPGSRKN